MLLHRGVPDTVTQFGMTLPLPPSPSRSLCLILLALPALLPVLPGALCHKDTEYVVWLPVVLPFSLKSEKIGMRIQQQCLEGRSERGG